MVSKSRAIIKACPSTTPPLIQPTCPGRLMPTPSHREPHLPLLPRLLLIRGVTKAPALLSAINPFPAARPYPARPPALDTGSSTRIYGDFGLDLILNIL